MADAGSVTSYDISPGGCACTCHVLVNPRTGSYAGHILPTASCQVSLASAVIRPMSTST